MHPATLKKNVQERFEEQNKKFKVLTWRPNSPDLNLIEHLWDVMENQVRSMEAPLRNLQDFSANVSVPDTTGHLQRSCVVDGSELFFAFSFNSQVVLMLELNCRPTYIYVYNIFG